MAPLKVDVVRKEWSGDANFKEGISFLYDHGTKRQCCLGFLCTTLGILKEELNGMGYIHNLAPERIEEFPILKQFVTHLAPVDDMTDTGQTDLSRKLTNANDQPADIEHRDQLEVPYFHTPHEKEQYIINKGLEAGIAFNFI